MTMMVPSPQRRNTKTTRRKLSFVCPISLMVSQHRPYTQEGQQGPNVHRLHTPKQG